MLNFWLDLYQINLCSVLGLPVRARVNLVWVPMYHSHSYVMPKMELCVNMLYIQTVCDREAHSMYCHIKQYKQLFLCIKILNLSMIKTNSKVYVVFCIKHVSQHTHSYY